ncbi:hypothetical protein PoB_006910200 [Plakobranchus ocellatus]|uniref:Uncharacterized protein n=1 Tax=Plakobranchus ocellatus TaxID=259542 RepID=A0AAV4DED3_9GAST|nr:hypothetical protein PoB_006910200 [Plakobranchus ocellatus]
MRRRENKIFAPVEWVIIQLGLNKVETTERLGGMKRSSRQDKQPLTYGGFVSCANFHNKVISGFQALCQARALAAGHERATEGSLQISERVCYPYGWTDGNLVTGRILMNHEDKNNCNSYVINHTRFN